AGLEVVYDAHKVLPQVVDQIARIHKARSAELRNRDKQRILQPDWFQDSNAVGYVCYTDLFAGDLQGIRNRIGYLKNLGVTYLHLMPLLNPRPGNSDGGYAVIGYTTLGTGTIIDFPAPFHNRASSFTFADGHAEIHKWNNPNTIPVVKYTGGVGSAALVGDADLTWLQLHASAK
ncbi:MAG: hypothetical protein EBU69_04155, partial [Methylophilaceae bacterium]|nr:hypothetical protein [Methylophilaceae bacterium]